MREKRQVNPTFSICTNYFIQSFHEMKTLENLLIAGEQYLDTSNDIISGYFKYLFGKYILLELQ